MSTAITPIRSFEPAIRKQQRLAARQHFGMVDPSITRLWNMSDRMRAAATSVFFFLTRAFRVDSLLGGKAAYATLLPSTPWAFYACFFPDFNFEHPDRNHNGNESFSFETHQSDLFSRKSAIDRRAFAQARCNFEIKMGRRVLLGWVRGIPVNGIIQTFRWSVLVSVFFFSFFPPLFWW